MVSILGAEGTQHIYLLSPPSLATVPRACGALSGVSARHRHTCANKATQRTPSCWASCSTDRATPSHQGGHAGPRHPFVLLRDLTAWTPHSGGGTAAFGLWGTGTFWAETLWALCQRGQALGHGGTGSPFAPAPTCRVRAWGPQAPACFHRRLSHHGPLTGAQPSSMGAGRGSGPRARVGVGHAPLSKTPGFGRCLGAFREWACTQRVRSLASPNLTGSSPLQPREMADRGPFSHRYHSMWEGQTSHIDVHT